MLGRVAGGRLDRAARLLDEPARARRTALLDTARAAYRDEAFDPAAASAVIVAAANALGAAAREREQALVDDLDLPAREAEQRVRRAEFGAEKAEVLASLDDLGGWYRDLVVVANGAEGAVVHADRLGELREDAAAGVGAGAEGPRPWCARHGARRRSSTSTPRCCSRRSSSASGASSAHRQSHREAEPLRARPVFGIEAVH